MSWEDTIRKDITWIKEGSQAADLGKDYSILNKLLILNFEAEKQLNALKVEDEKEQLKISYAKELINKHIKELQYELDNWVNHPQ